MKATEVRSMVIEIIERRINTLENDTYMAHLPKAKAIRELRLLLKLIDKIKVQ